MAQGGWEDGGRGLADSGPNACWLGSEAWYEGNLSAMLRCVDLSRSLLGPSGPNGNILMQLKVTALTSTRLCVRDWQDVGGRVAAHHVPLTTPPTSHSRRS